MVESINNIVGILNGPIWGVGMLVLIVGGGLYMTIGLKAVSYTHLDVYKRQLYNLTQEQLARTLMPVGAYTKEQIRELAKKISLKVASKPDSQEICFIPDNDYAKFIDENTDKELPAGNFVDMDGNVLGRHKGITLSLIHI